MILFYIIIIIIVTANVKDFNTILHVMGLTCPFTEVYVKPVAHNSTPIPWLRVLIFKFMYFTIKKLNSNHWFCSFSFSLVIKRGFLGV